MSTLTTSQVATMQTLHTSMVVPVRGGAASAAGRAAPRLAASASPFTQRSASLRVGRSRAAASRSVAMVSANLNVGATAAAAAPVKPVRTVV